MGAENIVGFRIGEPVGYIHKADETIITPVLLRYAVMEDGSERLYNFDHGDAAIYVGDTYQKSLGGEFDVLLRQTVEERGEELKRLRLGLSHSSTTEIYLSSAVKEDRHIGKVEKFIAKILKAVGI